MSATVDESVREDEVHLSINLNDGTTLSTYVEHATGSPGNPMTNETLESKYRDLATEVFDQGRADELLAAVWALDTAADVSEVAG